jgi:hypothetical protein
MSRTISEPDWKIFRQLHQVALERYCENILDDAQQALSDPSGTAHERYLVLYRLMEKRNKEVARIFNDFRRSTALQYLAVIQAEHLLTEEEMSRFSPETRELVQVLLGL